ncbi:MAG: hypothetical protein IKC87_04310 [Clostridia bacterium]|nr:hypothetical protein [Clostridia bacterium]
MKRLAKILSLVMVLSLVLSTFAVFSIFAEEAAAEAITPPDGRVVSYDMDSLESIALSADAQNGDSLVKLTDEYGQSYWQQKHDVDADAQEFWTVSLPGVSSSSSIILQDMHATEKVDGVTTPVDKDGDGKYDVKYAKNTDYFVIDFDCSTDSYYIPGLLLHMRFRADHDSVTLNQIVQNSATYPILNKGTGYTDTVKFSGFDDTTADSGKKWVNVTIIYDVSAVMDAEGLEAGTVTSFNPYVGYVYIDGEFMGNIGANWYRNTSATSTSLKYAKRFETIRMSTEAFKNGATTNLANYTISKFPVGYNGPLTEEGVLGNADIRLDNIADLAYTQANLPKNPTGYTGLKIADIVRTVDGTEQTFPCYSWDDLSADLIDGDKVYLYKAPESYVVVRGETNITWFDGNGTDLTLTENDPKPLYSIPTIYTANADSDWVTINNSSIYAEGKASDVYKKDTGALIDPFYDSIHASRGNELYLFSDILSFGAGPSGSTRTSANGAKYGVTIDLNGHTLTVATIGNKHWINAGVATNPQITFKNGTLNFGRLDDPTTEDVDETLTNGGNLLMMGYSTANSVNRCKLTFKNLTVNTYSGTFIDQRVGTVSYLNCTVNAHDAITSLKSQNSAEAELIIDNSVINCKSLTQMRNVSNKYGSFNLNVIARDSAINVKSHFLTLNAYAETAASPPENQAKNDNYAKISFSGCELYTSNASGDLLSASISSYAELHEMIKLTVDLNVAGSTLKANNLLGTSCAITEEKQAAVNIEVGVSEGCELTLLEGKAPAGIYSAAATNADANLSLFLANGVKLNSDKLVWNEGSTPDFDTVRYGYTTSKIAYTSNYEGYNFIVTSSYAPYTYQLGTQAPVDFYWNVPAEGTDEVDINKVVTLASEEGVYKYSWAQDGNAFTTVLDKDFGLSAQANLTLWSDLYFNLYVPKSIVEGLSDYVSVVDADGALVEGVYVESLDAYKYQIKSLAPTDAEKEVIFVKTTVNGAYGDTYNSSKGFTVAEYAGKVLGNATTEDDAVIYALLNYLNAMYVLNNGAVDEDIDALLPDDYTAAAISGEAKLGTLADTTIAINCGTTLNWVITGAANASYDVQYYLAGQLVERTVTADADGVAYVNVSTMDMLSAITVNGAEINIQGYYGKLVEMGAEAKVIAAVEAIYDLATAAVAYNA